MLMEHYSHILLSNKSLINVGMVTLLPEHLFNMINVEKYCFILKYYFI